jgi:hypothetical protein
MLADIEKSILNLLNSKWASAGAGSISEFNINLDFSDIIGTPAVSIAIESIGSHSPVDGVITLEPVVSIYQVYKDVGNLERRRSGVYAIIGSVVRMLSFSTLGLDIEPLEPAGSKEIFHEKLKDLSCVCFKSDFKTSYDEQSLDDSGEIDLLSESLRYYKGATESELALDAVDLEE